MSNSSRTEAEEETKKKFTASESEEDDEELDEFGRVKRRREKFTSERSTEDLERSDSETEERRRPYRRHHSSRHRSPSASPRRYSSRRYSDSDSEHNGRHYRSGRSSYHSGSHHSNSNSHHHSHHRHRRRGDPYSEAAQYIDTEFYPTKVYIGDLVDVSKEQVKSVFSRFGPLQEVKLVEGKDYGFITFEQKEAALAAIQSMHGALLGSRNIKVNRAKIPERNKVGFGNVPWTDEDGLMAKELFYSHSQVPSSSLLDDPINPPDMNKGNLPPRRALTSYDDL